MTQGRRSGFGPICVKLILSCTGQAWDWVRGSELPTEDEIPEIIGREAAKKLLEIGEKRRPYRAYDQRGVIWKLHWYDFDDDREVFVGKEFP